MAMNSTRAREDEDTFIVAISLIMAVTFFAAITTVICFVANERWGPPPRRPQRRYSEDTVDSVTDENETNL
jgi:hypothetical protein